MNKILIALAALVATAFIACGGGGEFEVTFDGTPAAEVVVESPAPTATAAPEPTAIPEQVLDEAWAAEQIMPALKDSVEALLDQRYNDLYDMLSAESKDLCSRTEYISNMIATMLVAEMFGIGELLEAWLLEIESGTYPLTFSEISAERIVYMDDDGESFTSVYEDGQWLGVDDGTCAEMAWGEDDD